MIPPWRRWGRRGVREQAVVFTPGLTYISLTEVDGAYPTDGQIVGTPTKSTPQRQDTLTVMDTDGNEARRYRDAAVRA